MSQSSIIFIVMVLAFLVYITSKGRLPEYMAVFL
jgi:hypothetical protein